MRATSKARAVCGLALSIKQIFAVVPPMSNDTTWSSLFWRAMQAAKIAPPAGPDSTRRTGKRMAVSVAVMPPLDVISSIGQEKPARASSRASVAR